MTLNHYSIRSWLNFGGVNLTSTTGEKEKQVQWIGDKARRPPIRQ